MVRMDEANNREQHTTTPTWNSITTRRNYTAIDLNKAARKIIYMILTTFVVSQENRTFRPLSS